LITVVNTNESWRDVSWKVLVTLFVSVVLWNVVKVFTTENKSSLHLGGDNNTSKNTTTNGNVTSEWALLINVVTFNGFLWCLETKTDFTEPSLILVLLDLGVLEDTNLLLESSFSLYYNNYKTI
jgi:hypothetical protein